MRIFSGAISDIRRHFVTTLTTDSEPAQVARLGQRAGMSLDETNRLLERMLSAA
jgi:hypothetical protein